MKVSVVSFDYCESVKFLYNKLKEYGVEIEYCFATKQTKEKILQISDLVEENSDIVFYVGGLGLSSNDVLKETLAQRYKVDMVIQQTSCDFFAKYIQTNKKSVPPDHVQQRILAFPDGFDCYPNSFGYELSAFGRFFGKEIFLLPDNVEECKCVFNNYIKAFFDKQTKQTKTNVYKVFGLEKSDIELKLFAICENKASFFVETDVANDSKIIVRFGNKIVQSVVDEVNCAIMQEFADFLYAVDDCSLNEIAVDLLKLYKRQLSVAESLTGGEIVASLVDVPGASEVLFEGCTTYANGAKNSRLFVKKQTLEQFGAVSQQTAYQMATGLLETSQCDVVVATTGIAGPGGGSERKPVGLTYIAVGDLSGIHIHKYIFSGNRNQIRQKAAKTALFLLVKLIKIRK
ncbi:MAG: nicotinamide-nucleotide amidohydrolase family protein [Clostridia bacterium]|nr:nicotinamide-nucleotide amidohydrolase family protein [Clostridia bacterium]